MQNSLLKSFAQSRRGNFAMMLAFTAVPMLAAVGLVVDYSIMSKQQSELQNAVDSAVLSAGIYYRENGSLPSTEYVERLLKANFAGDVKAEQLTLRGDDEIYLAARINTNGFFLDRFDGGDFKQTADATVPVSQDFEVEVAMVLDTTGSMAADGKMVALKTVAGDFVDTLLSYAPPAQPDAVRIGLVPFADYVNVGVSNRNQPWLDVPPDQTVDQCRTTTPLLSKSGCSTETVNHPREYIPENCWPAQYNDGVMTSPGGCNPGYWRDAYTSTSETCTNYEYGPPETTCTPVTTTWHGCVGSRAPALNVRDQAYSNPVPGLLGIQCTSPIEPLTSDGNRLKASINAFTPNRETYIGTGASWGYRLLTRRAPFTEGQSFGDDIKKFLIVMSDGDNTRAPNVGANKELHDNGDTSYANDQTSKACREARDQDIVVYTISFGTTITADGQATLLDCAGDNSRYFEAKDAAALEDAFDAIARAIFTLKLTS